MLQYAYLRRKEVFEMSLLTTMQKRRSVRKYNTEPVTEKELNDIISAALLAPNGKGLRPWEFVVVREKDTLRELMNCRKGGAKMLETANVAIAVYSDSDKTDTYTEDSSIAMTHMLLEAADLGLGAVWLQIRLRPSNVEGVTAEEFVNARLNPPKNMQVEALLVLGHIDEQPKAHELPSFPSDKVHNEKW